MKPINVTKPYLPDLDELQPLLQEIWDNKILTNAGPLHNRFENELASFLGVRDITLFSNATVALVTVLQAMRLTGEVITTPFSFLATSNALAWNSLTPVFVDVEKSSLNIDPSKIEEAITPETSAILAVHCYGAPCNFELIQNIADRHGLKVIYDAAHAFGVKDAMGGSVLKHGDASIVSTHATKVLNTFEGGFVVSDDDDLKSRLQQLRNFGIVSQNDFIEPGINGKLSEVHAALGIVQLRHFAEVVRLRSVIDRNYRLGLRDVSGLTCLSFPEDFQHNFSYFPVLVRSRGDLTRDSLCEFLEAEGVFARKYFYPLISDMPAYKNLETARNDRLTVARDAADSILCLPIYPDLTGAEVDRVIRLIISFMKQI